MVFLPANLDDDFTNRIMGLVSASVLPPMAHRFKAYSTYPVQFLRTVVADGRKQEKITSEAAEIFRRASDSPRVRDKDPSARRVR
jgi:hypothetical protein